MHEISLCNFYCLIEHKAWPPHSEAGMCYCAVALKNLFPSVRANKNDVEIEKEGEKFWEILVLKSFLLYRVVKKCVGKN